MARKPKKFTTAEIEKAVLSMSVQDFMALANKYAEATATDVKEQTHTIVQHDLQNRLIKYGVNKTCPYCGAMTISSRGKRDEINRYKCNSCSKSFTVFTNTILEKTHLPWDAWVSIVHGLFHDYSLDDLKAEIDLFVPGVDRRTVSTIRHKITHAMAEMPLPKLKGVISIDETHFRESQKGTRQLVSYVPGYEREPRYGQQPSHFGVMGNEFATVVCMVDKTGHVVSKVVGLGKLTLDAMMVECDPYIVDPVFLCTDGNNVYCQYAEKKDYHLYIRQADYLKVFRAASAEAKNDKELKVMLSKLYAEQQLDFIYGQEYLKYEDFEAIKAQYGLNISAVNSFHATLKEHLLEPMRGVTTKFLKDYVGAFTYLRNWSVDNGDTTPTTKEHAEKILVELIMSKTRMTVSDIVATDWNIDKTSARYMHQLMDATESARILTGNKYFKFDEEDGVVTFDKRYFLRSLPSYKLKEIKRHLRIPLKYNDTISIEEIMKSKNVDKEILLMIDEYKQIKMQQEDEDFEKAKAYVASLLGISTP